MLNLCYEFQYLYKFLQMSITNTSREKKMFKKTFPKMTLYNLGWFIDYEIIWNVLWYANCKFLIPFSQSLMFTKNKTNFTATPIACCWFVTIDSRMLNDAFTFIQINLLFSVNFDDFFLVLKIQLVVSLCIVLNDTQDTNFSLFSH